MASRFNIEDWIDQRDHDPVKVKILDDISRVLSVLDISDDIRFQTEKSDAKAVLAEGNPVINLVRIFNHDHYRYLHRPSTTWRLIENPVDERSYFKENGLLKYDNRGDPVTIDYDAVLFLPSYVLGEQVDVLRNVIDWCKQTKTRVLFRTHPAVNIGVDEVFDQLSNDYAILDKTSDTIELIENASLVISFMSSICIPAMIYGKPVATLYKCGFSDIVPRISIDNAFTVKRLPDDDVHQYLDWYKNVYCIDIDSKGYVDRVLDRVSSIKQDIGYSKMMQREVARYVEKNR